MLNFPGLENAVGVGVRTGLDGLTTGAAVGTRRLRQDVDQGANGIARVACRRDLVGLKNPVVVQVKPALDAHAPGWAVRTRGFIVLPHQRVHAWRAVGAVAPTSAVGPVGACRTLRPSRPSRAFRPLRPGRAIAHYGRGRHFGVVEFAIAVLVKAELDTVAAGWALAARAYRCHAGNGIHAVQIGLDPGFRAAVTDVELGIAPHVVHFAVLAGSAGRQRRTGQGELHPSLATGRRRGCIVLARTRRRPGKQTRHCKHRAISTATINSRRREIHQFSPFLKVRLGVPTATPWCRLYHGLAWESPVGFSRCRPQRAYPRFYPVARYGGEEFAPKGPVPPNQPNAYNAVEVMRSLEPKLDR